MLTPEIGKIIDEAEAKALATTGACGINVVPVSVLTVKNSDIILYNFFMGKTIENIETDSEVALTVWAGLAGLQIKAKAEYITEGDLFANAKKDMEKQFPDRTLSGVIVLTPHRIYDISADAARAGKKIS